MEAKNYPPLPSNYVTLAQLQERWLKEKEIKQKQKLLQQDHDPMLHHPHLPQDQQRQPKTQQQAWRVIPRHGTGFGSATGNLQPKKFRPKNRNFSKSDRVAIEVRCEKQDNMEAKTDIGNENAGHDGKRKESKKKQKRVHRKPRADREDRRVAEDAVESTMEGGKEVVHSDVQRVDEKTESKSELNVKSKNLVMELKKQKRVNRKPRADKEESRVSQDAAEWTMEGNKEVKNSDVQSVDDKTDIKSELNGKRNNLMNEVEGKLGTLSMKSGSEKQNGRLRRLYNSFHGSQRNYGGRPYNNGPYGDNGRFRSRQVQRPRGDKKIWVRKNENSDGNDGGIEIASGTYKGPAEAVVLGFQHYFLTLGMTVLIPTIIVPQMGGGDAEKARVIQSLLFVSGLSTFLQSLFGTRLPTVVVGSYTYIIPTISIIQASRYNSYTDPYERFTQTIRGIQGALIISACFQMVMGFLGFWRNAVRFLSPLSVVPYVTFTGLGLYHLGFPMLAKCVEIGLPALIIMVFISQYLNRYISTGRPICDRFAVLFSAASVWLYAQLLTSSTVYNHKPQSTQTSCRTDRAGLISAAPWIYIPYPFQWGSPTFNAGEAFAMIAASLVSLFESTGTFYAAARYGSATPVPPSVIGRGAGWVGVGVLLNGMFGSVTGSTASVENAGLLALTRVGSRRVIQISAGFMIFFSVFGKFGAFFASVPLPIIAALYCVFFGYVSSAGLGFLQFCNLNSFRTKFVLGFSFFLGISVPQYLREYYNVKHEHAGSSWLNDIVTVIFMSHSTVAALVAFILDITLSRDSDATRKDSGLQWWEKFSLYNADVRNNEFYALPYRLDELFPPL